MQRQSWMRLILTYQKTAPYYEPRGDMDAREAISLIRQSGGVSVIAHPYHYGLVDSYPVFCLAGAQGHRSIS